MKSVCENCEFWQRVGSRGVDAMGWCTRVKDETIEDLSQTKARMVIHTPGMYGGSDFGPAKFMQDVLDRLDQQAGLYTTPDFYCKQFKAKS